MNLDENAYNILNYKNRMIFFEQLARDYDAGGVELLRSKMRQLEWLWLMGLYDTMFIVEFEGLSNSP